MGKREREGTEGARGAEEEGRLAGKHAVSLAECARRRIVSTYMRGWLRSELPSLPY